MRTGQIYIGGKWLDGQRTFTTVSPSTGAPFGQVPQAQPHDVDAAVRAARSALGEWRASSIKDRSEIVTRVAGQLTELYGQQGEPTALKELIKTEMGKRIPEADIEVMETADMLGYLARTAPAVLQPRELQLNQELWPSKRSHVVFEPVGIVGVIKPWNYPLELPMWAIVPALLAGNTVVFKPSEHSSFVGIEIAKLFEEAGTPAGVFNLVTGDGKVGQALVKHPDVDMISFTGSVHVGREIGVECATRGSRCSLELGGNDAAIVLPDADLDLAANGLVWGAICNSGQVCVGTKRAFVDQHIAPDLTRRVVEIVKSLRPGADYGPLVSLEQVRKVELQVKDAVDQGATVLAGGGPSTEGQGFYYLPTVLTDMEPTMAVMQDECFGPILPIVPVTDMHHAIEMANNTPYGLGASVWTSDLRLGERVSESLRVGMVWVNDVNVAFAEAPWGGIKASGPGVELSEWGIIEFTNKKHVSLETSSEPRREWWYPYPEDPDARSAEVSAAD